MIDVKVEIEKVSILLLAMLVAGRIKLKLHKLEIILTQTMHQEVYIMVWLKSE